MKKTLKIRFRGKKIIIKNYIICGSLFSRVRGLMFRGRNFRTPLLFVFKKPGTYPIHSLFCRKFLAVWMLGGSVVDVKAVAPGKLSVAPAEKFDSLLEIPLKS